MTTNDQYTGHTLAWAMTGNRSILHLLKGTRGSIGPFHKSLCGSRANANGWHTTSLELGPRDRLCARCERSYNVTLERATTKQTAEKVQRAKSFLLTTIYDDGSTFSDYFVSEGAAKRFVAEAHKYERKHERGTAGLRFIESYTITNADADACTECANAKDACVCVTGDDSSDDGEEEEEVVTTKKAQTTSVRVAVRDDADEHAARADAVLAAEPLNGRDMRCEHCGELYGITDEQIEREPESARYCNERCYVEANIPDESLLTRVEGALIDGGMPQAQERQIGAHMSTLIGGFVVDWEPRSEQYVRVTYVNPKSSVKEEMVLNAYAAILRACDYRVHVGLGRVLVGEPTKHETMNATDDSVKEWTVNYTEEDVREQRLELMLECAAMFANGMKRAYANHLVESWVNHTLPKIGREFCLVDDMATLVYDKVYAIYCMEPNQVARVYKYSRADWAQTASGVMRSCVRQDRVLDAASAIDKQPAQSHVQRDCGSSADAITRTAVEASLYDEGTRYSPTYKQTVWNAYTEQKQIGADDERALEAVQATYGSQGVTVLSENYGVHVDCAHTHYHLQWWAIQPDGHRTPESSVSYCKHQIDKAFERTSDLVTVSDVSVHACVGKANDDGRRGIACRMPDCAFCEYSALANEQATTEHYHVAYDQKVNTHWTRSRSSACCVHQLPRVHDGLQQRRGEGLSDIKIESCANVGCATVDECGVCGR